MKYQIKGETKMSLPVDFDSFFNFEGQFRWLPNQVGGYTNSQGEVPIVVYEGVPYELHDLKRRHVNALGGDWHEVLPGVWFRYKRYNENTWKFWQERHRDGDFDWELRFDPVVRDKVSLFVQAVPVHMHQPILKF